MSIAGLRAALAILCLAALTLLFIPAQILALRVEGGRFAGCLPVLWHRAALRALGLRLEIRGAPAVGRPLLLVSNHQSWSDIVALGSVMKLSFIAKSEVRRWPVFGALARLQRTVFVAREARASTGQQAGAIAARLSAGEAMVLFAEGTTSDGNTLLPFKTALFGAAQAALRSSSAESVLVQPVAVAYTRVHGLPLGRFFRPLAAWPGDLDLLPHVSAFLREGAIDAVVVFGEPIAFAATTDRKSVARLCESRVRDLLAEALRQG